MEKNMEATTLLGILYGCLVLTVLNTGTSKVQGLTV